MHPGGGEADGAGGAWIHAASGATTAAAPALTPRKVLEAKERWWCRPR